MLNICIDSHSNTKLSSFHIRTSCDLVKFPPSVYRLIWIILFTSSGPLGSLPRYQTLRNLPARWDTCETPAPPTCVRDAAEAQPLWAACHHHNHPTGMQEKIQRNLVFLKSSCILIWISFGWSKVVLERKRKRRGRAWLGVGNREWSGSVVVVAGDLNS